MKRSILILLLFCFSAPAQTSRERADKGYVEGLTKAAKTALDQQDQDELEAIFRELKRFKANPEVDPNALSENPTIHAAQGWYLRQLKSSPQPNVFGKPVWLSQNASYTTSSQRFANQPPLDSLLNLNPRRHDNNYAFTTRQEIQPHILIDLGRACWITEIHIKNATFYEQLQMKSLSLRISRIRKMEHQTPNWTTDKNAAEWTARFDQPVPGQFIRIGLDAKKPTLLQLSKVKVYGHAPKSNPTQSPSGIILKGKPELISKDATYTVSSQAYANRHHTPTLLSSAGPLHEKQYAFITRKEVYPFIIVDLSEERTVSGFYIENRKSETYLNRAATLSVWTSLAKIDDMPRREPDWKATQARREWSIDLPPRKARYVCIGLNTKIPETFHLARVQIFGE